eukprot:g3505.t1
MSLFGGNADSNDPSKRTGGLFGGGGGSQAAGGSLFGNGSQPSGGGGGGLFGGGAQANNQGANQAPPATTGGLFGGGAPAAGGSSLFGGATGNANANNGASGGGGPFGGGGATGSGNVGGGSLFGGGAAATSGGGQAGNTLGGGASLLDQQQIAAKTLLEQTELGNTYYTLQKLDNDRVQRNVCWTYAGISPGADQSLVRAAFQELSQFDMIKHGPDQNKFRQAVDQNPFEPGTALPSRILGFEQMKTHLLDQGKKLEAQENEIATLDAAVKGLRVSVEAKLSGQLAAARLRHLQLKKQLVQILMSLESSAIAVSACRRNYEKENELEQNFARLEHEATKICHLAELQYMAHGLALAEEDKSDKIDAVLGGGQSLRTVSALVSNQTELNEELHACFREKKREVDAIARRDVPLVDPTAAPSPPSGGRGRRSVDDGDNVLLDPDRVQLSVTSRTSLTSLDQPIQSHRLSRARFFVLTMGAFMMFGSYYFFDQCSASEDGVRARLGITEPQFGLLQSVYSWPNTVLPLFGGLLIDLFGIRKSLILFMSLVFAGQVLYSFGLLQQSYTTAMAGRVVFGLGGESLNVASLALVALWFKGQELAFAMGIIICVSRLGSVCAFNTQEQMIESEGVPFASFVGSGIMAFSYLNCLAVCLMDARADKIDARAGFGKSTSEDEGAGAVAGAGGEQIEQASASDESSSSESVDFKQILNLGLPYWLITFSCVTVYISAFPFFQVTSVSFLTQNFSFNKTDANFITSIPNLVSAFTSPLFGLFVDRRGKRPFFMCLSTVFFITCFSAFILYGDSCHQCWSVLSVYVLLGGALCLFGAVMWPCIPLVVDPKLVGTAFGVTTAVQNMGLGVAPLAFTTLKDGSGGEFGTTFAVIIASNVLAMAAGVYLRKIDKTELGEKLGKP